MAIASEGRGNGPLAEDSLEVVEEPLMSVTSGPVEPLGRQAGHVALVLDVAQPRCDMRDQGLRNSFSDSWSRRRL